MVSDGTGIPERRAGGCRATVRVCAVAAYPQCAAVGSAAASQPQPTQPVGGLGLASPPPVVLGMPGDVVHAALPHHAAHPVALGGDRHHVARAHRSPPVASSGRHGGSAPVDRVGGTRAGCLAVFCQEEIPNLVIRNSPGQVI